MHRSWFCGALLGVLACGENHGRPCDDTSDCRAELRCEAWSEDHDEAVGACPSGKCCMHPVYQEGIDRVRERAAARARAASEADACQALGNAALPAFRAFLAPSETTTFDVDSVRARIAPMDQLVADLAKVKLEGDIAELRDRISAQAKRYADKARELHAVLDAGEDHELAKQRVVELQDESIAMGRLVQEYNARCAGQ